MSNIMNNDDKVDIIECYFVYSKSLFRLKLTAIRRRNICTGIIIIVIVRYVYIGQQYKIQHLTIRRTRVA